ncbi:beta-glucosidase 12-like [Silene latifolia]|uniref:beta-glucosidase 12-like n=1 Tax=Silene latifolia TaxID=37657 RepID=UPI003D77AE01
MKDMGLDAYRFSISWPRLLPYGKLRKGVNKKGLAYYHNLIDELLSNGIKPFVTLFHWDLPQALEDEYGGFRSPLIVEDFRDYANLCFREFGNKVKHWITLNEPWTYSYVGYGTGEFAPGRCSEWQHLNCTGGDSATEPYLVSHHQLLAHAAAVHLYRTNYQASQKGIIGITLVSHWFVPRAEVRHHRNAALRALDFMLGWFMDPLTNGEYPPTMRSLVRERLPSFSMEQSKMVNGSFDFLGLNYYTAYYAAYDPSLKSAQPSYITDSIVRQTVERDGILIGPKGLTSFTVVLLQAASDWLHVYPRGIQDLLIYIKRKYNDPLIFITENGVDELNNETLSVKDSLSDTMRVQYHHDHLAFLHLAIKEGVNVKGYFPWSLLDNFEWSSGYTVRFGFNYIDYKDGLKRYPKLSAQWFRNFLQRTY